MAEEDLQLLSISSDSSMDMTFSQLYSGPSLKRRASPTFEIQEDTSRKRIKEDTEDAPSTREGSSSGITTDNTLIEDLAQELSCGCCSELVYRPVLVAPCQHFFCGR